MRFQRCVSLAVLFAASVEVRADLVTNGSFEMGTTLPTGAGEMLPNGSTAMTGWTVFGGNSNDKLAWLGNDNPYGPTTPFGNYFLDLTGYRDQAPYFGIEQTITTVANQNYLITFYLGVDTSKAVYNGPVGVDVYIGSTHIGGGDSNPLGPGSVWQPYTLEFTASSSSTVIKLQGTQGDQFIGLDDVSVIPAVVPEPSSLLLLGLGVGSAGLILRTRGQGGRRR